MSKRPFRHTHQTVEHCLRVPMPENVSNPYRSERLAVFFADLPASVWAVVKVDPTDIPSWDLLTFPSASLRQEWFDRFMISRQAETP